MLEFLRKQDPQVAEAIQSGIGTDSVTISS